MVLTPTEARVLGVLVEKASTVPDSYPLSLNALTLGCNQKTARDPVLNLSDADVLQALEGLRERSLVNEVSGARVVRYEHNAPRALGLPGAAVALLTLLVLRGPQTAAELRQNCERLHRFADLSSVEGFLDELAQKAPARVVKLARAPGAREARWAHLICGEPVLPAATAADTPLQDRDAIADDLARLQREHAQLAVEVARLSALVQRMARDLGIEAG